MSFGQGNIPIKVQFQTEGQQLSQPSSSLFLGGTSLSNRPVLVTLETLMQIPLQVPTFESVHVIPFSASPGPGGWGIVQLRPPGCQQLLAVAAGGFGSARDWREFHGMWGGC